MRKTNPAGRSSLLLLLSVSAASGMRRQQGGRTRNRRPRPRRVDDPSAPGPYPVGVMEVTFTTTVFDHGGAARLEDGGLVSGGRRREGRGDRRGGGRRSERSEYRRARRGRGRLSSGHMGPPVNTLTRFLYNASPPRWLWLSSSSHRRTRAILFADCVTITGCSTEGMT